MSLILRQNYAYRTDNFSILSRNLYKTRTITLVGVVHMKSLNITMIYLDIILFLLRLTEWLKGNMVGVLQRNKLTDIQTQLYTYG